ncbi:MAG: TrkH family potassium uptake protein [Nitrospirota bacterium]|nr:TrkH family potassium uptake protein [Nitrospirota bacterium]
MEERQIDTLSSSVRPRVLLKYIGQLCLVISLLISVIVVMSVFFAEYSQSLSYAIAAFVLAVAGFLFSRLSAPADIQPNEALVISFFIFLFAALAAAYPMTASGISFQDAFFESISGVTTTGLSTLADVSGKPKTFLFARAWLQWFGGLGIVVLSLAILIRPGMAARRLIDSDETEDILGGTRNYARKVLKVYVALTVFGLYILLLTGIGFVPALVHTLAAVSTGGFSSYQNSLSGIDNGLSRALVILVSCSGAVSLALFYRGFKKGGAAFAADVQIRWMIVIWVAGAVLLSVSLGVFERLPWRFVLGNAPFLALSAQTTTGFSTVNPGDLGQASKLLLICLMMIGGSIGSTAGGIKVVRFLILLRLLKLTIVRTCMPQHAVVEPRLSGERLEPEEIEGSLLIILLFIIVVVVSWIPFVISGYDPLDSLFEVVSAACTVGLSTGITSQDLPAFLKGVLGADMLMGRLEIVAVLVVLYPRTWIGRKGSPK